jgi:hypothetical protein
MPLTIKRTNSTSIAANSVLFNGSNQYLSVANASAVQLNTGNFTIEGWIYATAFQSSVSGNDLAIICSKDGIQGSTYASYSVRCINSSGAIKIKVDCNTSSGGGATGAVTSTTTINTGTWYHFAYVRNGATAYLYINGTQEASAGIVDFYTTTNALYIGYENNAVSRFYWPGYISNFRIVKGTALYTSSFTPPTTPLTAIANTALLTCNAATIVDSSTNNFAITNNNAATVSSINPFRAPINNFQFARRASTAVGRSVQFDGSNQYLSVNRILDNSTDVTIEAWVRVTSTPLSNSAYIISQYVASAADRTIFAVGPDLKIVMQIGSTSVTSVAAITLNTWNHLAWVRSGSGANNFSVYINGTRDGQMTYTGTFQNTPTTIGGTNNLAGTYFSGYISNLRILKGTALYTGASFTPSTTPLTAIANTSLLTCNAATIVDSSTNNFAITNNNGATVSSTSPFVSSGGGMSLKKVFADPVILFGIQKAIFGYGFNGSNLSMTNLVSNTGVVATDTTGVGTARHSLAAAGYGTDKAIFGYGIITGGGTPNQSITNLVSNLGVVATDTAGVGTARYGPAASGYGIDKAIFGYGYTTGVVSMTNLVSNTGVVATDTTGIGTSRHYLAATGYGSDKAIFGYGYTNVTLSMTNLVSNTGVVATDTTGVGTARLRLGASRYGTDTAIFGYGSGPTSLTNKVSNTGIVATDTSGVGTARESVASAYGTDKAIFGYGYSSGFVSMTNLVSNTGVVASDTTGVGTARSANAAAGYSLT